MTGRSHNSTTVETHFLFWTCLLGVNVVNLSHLVLARNEAANQWLREHPAVTGCLALALGGVLLASGISSLKSGQATGKWGTQHEGGSAYVMGAIRAIAGAGAILFGLYQLVISVMG